MKALRYTGIVAFAIMLASCSGKTENTKPGADGTAPATNEKVFPVRTQHIKKQSKDKTLEYTANLTAFKEIHYAPASPGRIEKINVEVGSRVSKGQILVETDRTNLTQALTQLENAKTTFERIDTLYQLGSTSEQQYDQAKTQYDIAKSNVDFLKENTTLTSPINGIVTGKYFENGEMYSGSPNTEDGKAAVLSLMQINPLKAVVNISQSYFPVIKEGLQATITTDIYKNKIFNGKISKVYPTINPATRTFDVEILVENSTEELRPGMFARIEIKLAEAEALIVPAISVLKQEGTNNRFVFINDNGKAKQIEVTIGKRTDDMVEIISNEIKEGTELIVEGQANLLNGSKVKVVTE